MSLFGENSEQPSLVIPNLYESHLEKLSEKIQNGNFWPSEFVPVFWEKLSEKMQNGHF